jgi:hypothetical protein
MVSPASTLKQRVRGFNKAVRGAAQTAGPAVIAAAPYSPAAANLQPQIVPSMALYGTAQQGIQRRAEAIGADPDTAELIGNVAMLGIPAAKAGMPRVGRFVQRSAPRDHRQGREPD